VQGGDLDLAVRYGIDTHNRGIMINSSRGIIYAGKGADFAKAARQAAQTLRDISINVSTVEEITGEKIFKFQIPKTKQLTIFNLRYLLFFKIYVLFGIGRLKFCIFTMTDINLGDVVRLKKQHPCGSYDCRWSGSAPTLASFACSASGMSCCRVRSSNGGLRNLFPGEKHHCPDLLTPVINGNRPF